MILTKAMTVDNKPFVIYSMPLDHGTFIEQKQYSSVPVSLIVGEVPTVLDTADKQSPISYLSIVVVGYTNDGKCAAFDKSVLINGNADPIVQVGQVKEFFNEKQDIGFDCLFSTNGKEFEITVVGLDKTEVNWVVNIEKII
jgi:hypothetical protein